jgi:hypothetical protein
LQAPAIPYPLPDLRRFCVQRKRGGFRSHGERQASFRKTKEASWMTVAKSLWASIQGDPVFMRRVNGWLTMFWLAMIPVSFAMGWLNSVVYVSALSLWALVSGHWSAWQAARVEVAQQRETERQHAEPLEEKIVDQLVAKTDVAATG